MNFDRPELPDDSVAGGPSTPSDDHVRSKATLEELRASEFTRRRLEEVTQASLLLSEAERLCYRDLFDEAPIGYVVTDPLGRIEKVNRVARPLLSGSPGEPVGRSLADTLVASDRDAFRIELDSLGRRGEMKDWEGRLPGPGGGTIRVVFSAAAVFHGPDGPSALRWIIREVAPGATTITDGRDPRSIGEIEATRIRAMIDGLDLIIWEAEPSGRVNFVNRRAEELLGYPAGSWLNRLELWQQIVHEDDREWVRTHHRRCFGQGHGGELEYRLITLDHRTLWFRESIRVIRDEAGRVEAIRGTMWEIGRRKKAERRLLAARQELADDLADMTYLHDLGRRLWTSHRGGPRLEEIATAAAAIHGAELGMVRSVDPKTGELGVLAGVGVPDGFDGRSGRTSPCGRAIETRSLVVVEDVFEDPAYTAEDRDFARRAGFRSCLSAPLRGHDGAMLGTILAGFRSPHRPGDRQLRLAERFAELASDFLDDPDRGRKPTIRPIISPSPRP